MNLIDKTWKRILLGLIGGGFAAEIIAISSGDPNHRSSRDNSSLYVFGFGIVIYFILTFLSKKNTR